MTLLRRTRLVCLAVIAAAAALRAAESGRVEVLRQLKGPNHTVVIIRFDYDSGKATRTVVDEKSGKVLKEEVLRGRPQSNKREFQRAVSIIAGDPNLSALLSAGAATEGGFIVDGPPGHPGNHRYIQIRILSSDRRTLLRVVVVDLSAEVVAAVRDSFE